jgi:hypothetical protein
LLPAALIAITIALATLALFVAAIIIHRMLLLPAIVVMWLPATARIL